MSAIVDEGDGNHQFPYVLFRDLEFTGDVANRQATIEIGTDRQVTRISFGHGGVVS